MNYRDPKPDIQRIEELVTGVKYGEIKLPKFQRPFVWKKKEVLKLLDSIYNGYPIGSILLWYTSEKLASERTIAGLEIIEKEAYPTNYLLDGQQRLSSLCGALYWNNNDSESIWNVSFDLDKEEFIHARGDIKIEYFPLNKLLNTSDFINQCKSFEAHPKRDKFFKNAEKLLRAVKDYKIAVVKIGEMTINEVAPIFERINSTGRKLTIVDLMRAATWKGGFDLNDAIENVRKICESLNYYDIPDSHILRNISACAGLGINREDIDKLRSKTSEDLELASIRCSEAYQRAIEFLKQHFPLPTYEYLPYGLQLTYLVEFFNIETNPNNNQISKLIKWFWITAISRHFGTSNTGQNARDLESIRRFAKNEIEEINVDRDILLDRFVFEDFRLNIANSKTFALLLAQKKPRNLVSGEKIDIHQILSKTNRHYFHHLIPQIFFPEMRLNVCINVCFVDKSESLTSNNVYVRPSQYFNYLIENTNENIEETFTSNFIDNNCLNALLTEDVEGFFNYRKELIRNEIEKLTGRNVIPNTGTKGLIQDEDDYKLF